MAYARRDLKRKPIMRRQKRQLRLIDDTPDVLIKLTDTSGNPSESYYWRQMAAVRREWQHEFWLPFVSGSEMTLAEITTIETRVRRELYP